MIELVAGTVDTSAAAQIRTTVWRWIVSEPEAIEHSRATPAILNPLEPRAIPARRLRPGFKTSNARLQ
jgi:hypothetical protein